MTINQKIIPHLWFDNNAEEAVNYYLTLFADSKITRIARYGDAGPGPKGSVMSISFVLNGQEFAADNDMPEDGLGRVIPRPVVWDELKDTIGESVFD